MMKKVFAAILAIVMVLSLAACKGGKKDEATAANSGKTTAAAEEAKVTVPADKAGTYESKDGWTVQYDADLIKVKKVDAHDVKFVYDMNNVAEICCVADKGPEELLYEVTENWGNQEDVNRTEGFFPGTTDKWGFWRELTNKKTGVSKTAIAGEYNGATLLLQCTSKLTGDEEADMKSSDALAAIVDSITYKEFKDQTMFDYYPGLYKCTSDYKIKAITLNADHTGTLTAKEDADITWGTKELNAVNDTFSYDFTIEGDNLYLLIDGESIEFAKQTGDTYVGNWDEKSGKDADMTIKAGKDGKYKVKVVWDDEDDKENIYTMNAVFQPETGTLYYEDCTYVVRTYDAEDETKFEDKTKYNDGSGLFNYDDGILYWTDYTIRDKTQNVTEFLKEEAEEAEPEAEDAA